ncbi:MAG: serine O-acetyltransferase [Thermoflexales bacterium]|nr:serine O-acetyltransferase [Thermoflexales bacterium]MDW8292614.1 serine O-acetyltransferase EpsC [Anaerolineae bacterium]
MELATLAQALAAERRVNCGALPDRVQAERFLDETLRAIFPNIVGYAESCTAEDARCHLEAASDALHHALRPLQRDGQADPAALAAQFFDAPLVRIARLLWLDAQAIYEGDPAARSLEEVIATYPGLCAIAAHRIAHWFFERQVPIFPRMLSEIAHQRTGIDIHPGAKIGHSFCIDHGTGVVIGETTVIGNRVKLYQGVTLGALSVSKALARSKRHPTIEDDVVIYANATILGGETVIGHHSIIGGNVWLTESVPPYSVVYHRAEVQVKPREDADTDEAFLRWYPSI